MSQNPYYVLEVRFVNQPPQTQSFNAPRVVIGRDSGDIILSDGQASAMHAELEFNDGQLVVRDLGSSNGTWKGDRTLPQFSLSAGDEFRCGNTTIKVVQIAGGKVMASGGTVMGDANMLAELKRQQMGGAAPGAAVAPPQKKGGAGVIIAIAAVLILLVGGGGLAYFLLTPKPEPETVATVVEEPEPEPEPEPKADIPPPLDVPLEVIDEPVVEKDLGELYKQVGAATVVIRVPGSVGSGAIIDPKGIVLTNHHVIDGGERDGLRIKVNITLGHYSEDLQAFEPDEDTLEGYVLKIDEDHDLALVQLTDPPEDLPALKFSEKQPYPGQKVAAVGHAGAGLLWAIKGGEVSSTGNLAGHTDLQLEDAEGYRKDALARAKAQMDKKGRVVQSTAKILPGDSGGPLVAMTGEIVGVNAFGRIDRATNQWLSFHVHLAEVDTFMAEVPEQPLDFIPDPWHLTNSLAQGADIDLDGTIETIVAQPKLGGETKTGFFMDLDQDSLSRGQAVPSWEDLEDKDKRKFDPELAVVKEPGHSHFWYDTDNDGTFDVYMLDSTGDGKVDDAYRVKDGRATEDESVLIDDGLDAKPFESSIVRDRFKRIGPVAFTGAMERETGSATPRPNETITGLVASDHDSDGVSESYVESSFFHRRGFFDLDQGDKGPSSFAMQRNVENGRADLEAVVMVQLPYLWAWYDTDEDGKLDLLLEGFAKSGTVAKAYSVNSSGRASGAVEGHVGRLALRTDLVPDAVAERWTKVIRTEMGTRAMLGSKGGIGSFPPLRVSTNARIVVSDRGGLTNAVAMVTEYGHDIVLVDLDSDTAKGKTASEVAKLAAAGKFDAEFALLTIGEMEWAYYDTDGKGGFDLVLTGRKKVEEGYTVSADSVEPLESPGSSLIQWGKFTKKGLSTKFSKVAPTLFPSRAVE